MDNGDMPRGVGLWATTRAIHASMTFASPTAGTRDYEGNDQDKYCCHLCSHDHHAWDDLPWRRARVAGTPPPRHPTASVAALYGPAGFVGVGGSPSVLSNGTFTITLAMQPNDHAATSTVVAFQLQRN
jgi:hypothetical protein